MRPRISKNLVLLLALAGGALALAGAALAAAPGGVSPSPGTSTSASVHVFPIPGSRVVSPQAQIAFRGISASRLGTIVVTGSRSGAHSGHVAADSDGHGGSFLPDQPFDPGETVTVSTNLNITGGHGGTFHFTVATPAATLVPTHWPTAPRARNDVWRFHSRPDLAPASVNIDKLPHRTAPGDIFIAPQEGPVQDGPMILGPYGGLIWFKPMTGDNSVSDFRMQTYQHRPVLTWWQGYVTAGVGFGQDVIYNSSYQQIATVNAANGLMADLHEFQLTSSGTALITAEYPVVWNASKVHLSTHETVLDSVVQEIDIKTGLVLFQWDSLDHVPLTESYEGHPGPGGPFDYFHVNSIDPDHDGNLIISARNTWAAYKVNHKTGAVMWRLGGRRSTFKLPKGVSWAFQHDVRVQAFKDMFITLFDDGAGPPKVQKFSRGIKLFLDLKHKSARAVATHFHSPQISANFEGNWQQLGNRDDFLGWGQQPYFTEYNAQGKEIFDGRIIGFNPSYRVYRFSWTGTPQAPPDVAATTHGSTMTVYASWNGSTNVASWRVLGGGSASSLTTLKTTGKRAFETAISVPAESFVAVQALDKQGHTLGTSATIQG